MTNYVDKQISKPEILPEEESEHLKLFTSLALAALHTVGILISLIDRTEVREIAGIYRRS
jgi:hypothetical protein